MNGIPFDGMDELRLRLSENAEVERERNGESGGGATLRDGGSRLDSLIDQMRYSQEEIVELMRRKREYEDGRPAEHG